MALPMVKQTELVANIAEATGYSKSDVRHFFDALEYEIVAAVSDAKRVKISGLVQIEPKLKKATKKRKGRNPQTGEEVDIPAKPASVKVAARILSKLKDEEVIPSVSKVRSRLR